MPSQMKSDSIPMEIVKVKLKQDLGAEERAVVIKLRNLA